MRCPHCDSHGRHPVADSRKLAQLKIRVRRRKCNVCGQLFTTTETHCPDPKEQWAQSRRGSANNREENE